MCDKAYQPIEHGHAILSAHGVPKEINKAELGMAFSPCPMLADDYTSLYGRFSK